MAVHVGPLNISEPTTGIFGETITITCSVEFVPHRPSAADVDFEWFFGPDNSTLPSDVIKSNIIKEGRTCSSTLHFSPLLSTHAGIYTCHFVYYAIGGNKSLTVSTAVSVGVTSASDVVGNFSDPNAGAVKVITAVFILIFIAAIVAVILFTVIVYR